MSERAVGNVRVESGDIYRMSTVQERVKAISRNNNLSVRTQPTMAKIELTGICTLNCHFCNMKEMRRKHERQKMMSDEDLKLALDYLGTFPEMKEVGLFYMGESSLHPKLADYYRELKERGYFTFLTTNATRIEHTLEAIPYVDSLKVSWNYKSEADFLSHFVYGAVTYQEVIDNIRSLYKVCHEHGKKLAVSTVLDTTKFDYIQSIKKLSFDEHYWIPLQNQGGTQENGLGGVVGESESQVSQLPCWSLFKGVYIDCDLDVRACCYGHGKEHVLGNLRNGFDTIKSKKIQMAQQLANKVPAMCKNCINL